MAVLSKIELAINQRVIQCFRELGLDKIKAGKTEFANLLEVSSANLSKYMSNDRPFPVESLVNLANKIPDISLEWLMLGIGTPKKYDSPITHTEIKQGGGLPLMVTVSDDGEENIVLVDTKAQGGYPSHHLEVEFYKDLPTIKLPSIDTKLGTHRAWEVNGESMDPTLHHGAVVLAKFVPDWREGNIKEGYLYVVVTKEFVAVKRVLNRLYEGKLYLMSDNEAYEGFPVEADQVQQLWLGVEGLINKFPNVRYEWRRKMSHMEADIFNLKQQMDSLQKALKK